MKKIKKLVSLFMITFLLTGCLKYNTTININKDKTMNLNMIIAYSKEMFEGGQTNEMNNIKEMENFKKNGFTVSDYSDDKYIGFKLNYNIQNIDDYSSLSEIEFDFNQLLNKGEMDSYFFTVEKGFFRNKYKANFKLDANSSLGDDLNTEAGIMESDELISEDNQNKLDEFSNELLNTMDLSFNVSLPYKAISSNATEKTNKNKLLKWNLAKTDNKNINFVFVLYNMTNVYIGLGIATLILLLIISLIITKIRGSKTKTTVLDFNQDVNPFTQDINDNSNTNSFYNEITNENITQETINNIQDSDSRPGFYANVSQGITESTYKEITKTTTENNQPTNNEIQDEFSVNIFKDE